MIDIGLNLLLLYSKISNKLQEGTYEGYGADRKADFYLTSSI